MTELVAFVDGSSHGSPGPSGIGIVLVDSTGRKLTFAKWIGRQDNNVAEYVALLEALQWAVGIQARSLRVYSDSQLVVKQMTGEYSCRRAPFYSLNWTCRKLASYLQFSITHIPREKNSEANRLANEVVHRQHRSGMISVTV